MEVIPIIIAVIVFVVTIFCIKVYNGLVALKHSVSKAWVNIEALLKQRHDQLPKLIELCKQCGLNEQALFEKIMAARTQVMNNQQMGQVRGLGTAEQQLQSQLTKLFELAQENRELSEDEDFRHLKSAFSGYERAILDRSETYNRCVIASNDRIEQFPYSFMANFFSFGEYEQLDFELKSDDAINTIN